jgi:hypothetical protein
MKLFRVSGYCCVIAIAAPTCSLNNAMRRTSQLVGLDFSTGRSISLLPVMASVAEARLIFMTFREPA